MDPVTDSVMEILPTSSDEDEVPHPVAPVDVVADEIKGTSEADCTEAAKRSNESHFAGEESGDVVEVVEEEEEVIEGDGIATVDVALCNKLKLEGNTLFGQGKVAEALAKYRHAILKAPIKPVEKPKPSAAAAAAADMVEDADEDGGAAASPQAEEAGEQSKSTSHADGETEAPVEGEGASRPEETDPIDYTLTAQVFCNAGYCLMKLDLHSEAVEMLSEAVRHDETYQKAYLRRADSYFHLEKWSSAYGDYEAYVKLGGALDAQTRSRRDVAKTKTDEEMQKMLGDLKDLGNRFLGTFGLSTDMFKFDKDPSTGSYSMRFERN